MKTLPRMLAIAVAVGTLAIGAGSLLALRSTHPHTFKVQCVGFDFPVGPPDAVGYYNAQPFGDNDHLGDDWNGIGGGNSDLGDPVASIADGIVTDATDHGGDWGKVVRVAHFYGDRPGSQVESLYAHLDTIEVALGDHVARGQRLGTIGTAGGAYLAHLHLELRDRPGLPLGPGYGQGLLGYLDPTQFIRQHRPSECTGSNMPTAADKPTHSSVVPTAPPR
jgi:murein DD-endopeptidase MepM/ murein hydrolase activator NlpD